MLTMDQIWSLFPTYQILMTPLLTASDDTHKIWSKTSRSASTTRCKMPTFTSCFIMFYNEKDKDVWTHIWHQHLRGQLWVLLSCISPVYIMHEKRKEKSYGVKEKNLAIYWQFQKLRYSKIKEEILQKQWQYSHSVLFHLHLSTTIYS